MSASLASVQTAACSSGIGKETNQIKLLQAIAQSLASATGLTATVSAIMSRACDSGIGKLTDKNSLLRIIAQSLCGSTSSDSPSGDTGLVESLISYWKMDELSPGNMRVDSVAGANSMTDITGAIDGNAGKINDGARGTYLTLGGLKKDNPTLSIAGNFSFNCWLINDWVSNTYQYLFALSNSAGIGFYIRSLDAVNPTAYQTYYVAVNNDVAENSFILPQSEWVMLTVTVDDTNMLIYKNGSFFSFGNVVNPALRVTPECASFLCRATLAGHAYEFDGIVDEAGFWNRALTAAEVAQLYNGGLGLPYSSF